MKSYGYDKPIWASDLSYSVDPMMTGPILLYPYHGNAFAIFQPSLFSKYWAVSRFMNILIREKGVGPYSEWMNKMQSMFTTKAIVTAIGEGVGAMNVHGTYNNKFPWTIWPYYIGGGTFGFTGMLENDWSHGAIPENPKPVYYQIRELMKYLNQYDKAECKTSTISNGNKIHRYDFSREDNKKLAVLWYDDRKGQLPKDAIPGASYVFDEGVGSIKILFPIVEKDKTKMAEMNMVNQSNKFNLTISEIPILILY